MYDREYDSNGRRGEDGFSWAVDLTYRLRSYSRFILESARVTNETNGLGNAVNTRTAALSWQHDWNSRSSTAVSVSYGNEDYTDSRREDDRYGVEAGYNYAFRRWLDLGVGYRYEDRDSSLSLFDYSRNEVFVQIRLSL